MATHIKIVPRKHRNKDGSEGKKNEYAVVVRRRRAGRSEVHVATTRAGAEKFVDEFRKNLVQDHIRRHPDDTHFIRKHYGEKAN